MTFRAKPVVSRPHRSSREGRSRRNFYLNVGFGLAVGLAVAILVGVVVVSWYSDHLAAAATVDGQTITKDDFRERGQIEVWRLEQQIARVQANLSAGRLTSAQADQMMTSLQGQAQTDQLAPLVIERLIDARIQARLAAEEGITVTPEQIDARIIEESTTPEERHAWMIAVQPDVDEGKTEPTDAQKAAAKAIADQALTDITSGGKTWEDVAKAISTDSSKTSGGDLGWITKDSAEDEPFLTAVFAAEQSKPTAVIEGADGTYRIGRVTEIAPAVVDSAWTEKLVDKGLKLDAYRKVVESDVIRKALEDKVVAEDSKPGLQRHVLEIAIQAPQKPPSDKAVKVRHILFSPNDDPQGAAEVPPEDPAWSVAELAAKAEYDTLKKEPAKFDELARKDSDETQALGENGTGGKLPYVDDDGTFIQEFVDAVLKEGLKAGDILEPIKTSFGWHVIQVMYRPPDVDEMKRLREQAAGGEDFKTLARNYSEGNEAGLGGDKDWVAKGILDDRLVAAIMAAPANGLSEVIEIKNAGVFLYKVIEERTQAPDAEQLEMIKTRAFQNWYNQKKDAVTITRPLLDDLQMSQ